MVATMLTAGLAIRKEQPVIGRVVERMVLRSGIHLVELARQGELAVVERFRINPGEEELPIRTLTVAVQRVRWVQRDRLLLPRNREKLLDCLWVAVLGVCSAISVARVQRVWVELLALTCLRVG